MKKSLVRADGEASPDLGVLPASLSNDSKNLDIIHCSIEDLPSPYGLASHPLLFKKIPLSCNTLWLQACGSCLRNYFNASMNRDVKGMIVALVKFLELPTRILVYMKYQSKVQRD